MKIPFRGLCLPISIFERSAVCQNQGPASQIDAGTAGAKRRLEHLSEQRLRDARLRASGDYRSEKLGAKIRRVPGQDASRQSHGNAARA